MSSAPTNYKSALLPELVKAIKFAYPDYGVNKIHAHVVKTHLLDLKKEYDDDARPEETKGSYRDATLGEMKKLYKTLSLSNHAMGVTGNEYVPDVNDMEKVVDNTGKGIGKMQLKKEKGEDEKVAAKEKEAGQNDPDTIRLFTVGSATAPPPPPQSDEDSSQPAISSATLNSGGGEGEEGDKGSSKQVPVGEVQLHVPMDKSGTKPHQALISYDGSGGVGGGGKGGKGKKAGKKKKKGGGDGWDVFKVQTADNSMVNAMLMYDQDKKHKTFIHPEQEEGSVYKIVAGIVGKRGVFGALGPTGGRKCYLRGRVVDGGKNVQLMLSEVEGVVEGLNW